MIEKIERLCYITADEIQKMVFGKWQTTPYKGISEINYTFDLNSLPSYLKEDLLQSNANVTITELSLAVRKEVEKSFDLWRTACGNLIKFRYQEKLQPNQPGVTVLGCENLTNAVGITVYNTQVSSTGEINFTQSLMCIPTAIVTPQNRKTVHHEAGHVIGLDHTQNVATLKERIKSTEQGLGCSVMGYNHLLSTSKNQCTVPEYCEDQTYAIAPGPMDSAICKALYTPQFMLSKYFNSMFYGLLNGSLEQMISTILMELKPSDIDPQWVERGAVILSAWIRGNAFNAPLNLENSFIVLELFSRLFKDDYTNSLKLIRLLASIVNIALTLYQLYSSEDALNRSIYLAAFVGANLAGMAVGETMGKAVVNAGSSLVDKLSPLFNWGVKKSAQFLPSFVTQFSLFKQEEKEETYQYSAGSPSASGISPYALPARYP